MNNLRYILINVLETLLRVLPFPCRTGLVKIGNPDRNSPVLLTGNFRLTVERLRRAIEGMDAYLLVANSRGVNVWCAATGGMLTNHDVVSVLKTSGIEDLVDHRTVILPQLAATGIEGRAIQQKAGWKVIWGPVYASAIPTFVRAGLKRTRAMGAVGFPWPERAEMAETAEMAEPKTSSQELEPLPEPSPFRSSSSLTPAQTAPTLSAAPGCAGNADTDGADTDMDLVQSRGDAASAI